MELSAAINAAYGTFNIAEATAAEATRDAGAFIGRNAPTAYKYGYACLEFGLVGSQSTIDVPGISQTAGTVVGCATGVGFEYLGSQP
jgi:hypothetical protein